MKKLPFIKKTPILIVILSLTLLYNCDDSNDEINNSNNTTDKIDIDTNETLTTSDIAALLFMLEEEKLARDTYSYLSNLWPTNQFKNIKNSEQTHMNAIEGLLIKNNIDYIILPNGEFKDQTLQDLYNQFEINGSLSQSKALEIGANIEDLDIIDLQNYIDNLSNTDIITVFQNLQCGSRNHLRSFVKGINKAGNSYIPQFLSQEQYEDIISASSEKCN